MKLSITKSDGTVSFVLDTKYITHALLIVLILLGSFTVVWSLAPPPFFYDIALSMLITWKLTPRTLRILQNADHFKYRLGLSATPTRENEKS